LFFAFGRTSVRPPFYCLVGEKARLGLKEVLIGVLIGVKKRSPLLIALIVALPVEIANFSLAGFPIDTGLEPNTSWYEKLIAYQNLYMHAPGWLLISRMQDSQLQKVGNPILFVSGYLDTAILIFASLLLFRWWQCRSRGTTGGLS